jgi:flavodoxin
MPRTITGPPGPTAISRRTLLRGASTAAAGVATAGLTACTSTPTPGASTSAGPSVAPSATSDRVLLAYFSRAGENYWNGGRRFLRTGNTEVLADMISDRIDCEVYRIDAAEPYPDRYDPAVERNAREQDSDARPQIANPVPDLSGYDTVLLGSPIWNVQPPMIMATFVEALELSGKTVRPFVTYAVSGLGSTEAFYRDLDTGARLGDGLAVRGEEVTQSGNAVDRWLRAAGLSSQAPR